VNPRYLPTDLTGKIDRVGEECAEVLQAIFKAKRFGLSQNHPDGGMNNAAEILNECANLRHAISQIENDVGMTAAAKVEYFGIFGDTKDYVWTPEHIGVKEMRELIGDDDDDDISDEDFLSSNKKIQVCHGEWHREELGYRFFADPEMIP
jgi:hypothetical protein